VDEDPVDQSITADVPGGFLCLLFLFLLSFVSLSFFFSSSVCSSRSWVNSFFVLGLFAWPERSAAVRGGCVRSARGGQTAATAAGRCVAIRRAGEDGRPGAGTTLLLTLRAGSSPVAASGITR